MPNIIPKITPRIIDLFKTYYLNGIIKRATHSNTVVTQYIKQKELEGILRFIKAHMELR